MEVINQEIEGIAFSSDDFLGIFQPHSLRLLDKVALTKTSGIVSNYVTKRGGKIAFCFENAAQFTPRFAKMRDDFNKNPDNSKNYRDRETFLGHLSVLSRSDDQIGHIKFITELFLQTFDLLGKNPKKVSAFSEKNPVMAVSSEKTREFFLSLSTTHITNEEKYTSSLEFLCEMVTREIVISRQILDARRNNTSVIVFRGTAHVGLIPALATLSHMQYPSFDFEKTYSVPMGDNKRPFVSVLWNLQFWKDIFDEYDVTLASLRNEKNIKKIIETFELFMKRSQWGDFILSSIEDTRLLDVKSIIELSQTLPVHGKRT